MGKWLYYIQSPSGPILCTDEEEPVQEERTEGEVEEPWDSGPDWQAEHDES